LFSQKSSLVKFVLLNYKNITLELFCFKKLFGQL